MKNRSITSSFSFVLCLAAAALLLRCSINGLGGNSSQTGNPLITGALYNQDGSGAKNALVTFVPVNYDPRSGTPSGLPIDSTMTDDTGGYRLDSLPEGVYNIFGRSAVGLSYRDSFSVPRKTPAVVPGDTLRLPGSIKGVVRLLPGDDSRTVFIIVMGTTTLLLPSDTTGNFELAGMAEGSYNVRLLSTLNYKPLDTVFTIKAGSETLLSDTIRLVSTAIPTPRGLKAGYDSLLQIVTLTWNSTAAGRAIKGYNVYRKHPDSNMVLLTSDWSDTAYVDSTGIQDMTYEYHVAAVDSQGTEGVKSAGVSVIIKGALITMLSAIVKGEGSGPGQFYGVTTGKVDSLGDIFIMDMGSARLQELDSAGNFMHKIENLTSPRGFEIGPGKTLFTLAAIVPKISKYDTNGVKLTGWSPQNTARSLLLVSDTLFVLTEKGIEKYDTAGGYLGQVVFTLDYLKGGGDFASDSSGNVYFSDGRGVYRLDKTGESITPIFSRIQDLTYNQEPRIECIGDRYILISTVGAISPFNSSSYLVNLSGALIGKWYSTEPITDIAVKTGTTCMGFSAYGKIVTLEINCPAP